jgi:hypothetical protein
MPKAVVVSLTLRVQCAQAIRRIIVVQQQAATASEGASEGASG